MNGSRLLAAIVSVAVLTDVAGAQTAADTAQVRVMSNPEGALVFLDGVPREVTPLTVADLKTGKHLLIVQKEGFREARRTFSLAAGQRMAIQVDLDPLLGLLLLTTTPPGAEVQIDGADRGVTPLFISDLPIGTYRIRFALTSHVPKEIDMEVRNRTPIKVDVPLTSDTAVLLIESTPPGATATLNGIAHGATPCRIERIPAGDNALELSLDGYEPFRQTVKVAQGQEDKLRAVLKPIPAEFQITSTPPKARIYVNDEFRGEAPLSLGPIEAGTYRLRAEMDAYDSQVKTVIVKRGEKRIEEFRLVKNCGKIEFTTEPAGVKILVDGKEAGATTAKADQTDRISEPFDIDGLRAGQHEMLLTKKGYYDKKVTITIERDRTVTRHERLDRRFIPNCEVKTATDVYRGVLVEAAPSGDVKLEIRPGITKTIPGKDIVDRRPLREE